MFIKDECRINSIYGDFVFTCYNFGSCENDNILVLKSQKINKNPIVRIQSACFTAEIFRSKDCDCHEQLVASLKKISKKGGILIYLLQDGRGAGIFEKVKGLRLSQREGLDTAEAYDKLGIDRDPREYDRVINILSDLNVFKLQLLTNNPRKIKYLENAGVNVTRIPLEIPPTQYSKPYLETKKEKLGHLFTKYI